MLPSPPWLGTPTGILPAESRLRVEAPPFSEWAFVIRCRLLLAYLAPAPAAMTKSILASQLPFDDCEQLGLFLDEVAACNRGLQGRPSRTASGGDHELGAGYDRLGDEPPLPTRLDSRP